MRPKTNRNWIGQAVLRGAACVVVFTALAAQALAQTHPPRRAPAPRADDKSGAPAIVQPATAAQLAAAMKIPAANIVSATIGTSDEIGVGVGTSPVGRFFPRQGSTFAISELGPRQRRRNAKRCGRHQHHLVRPQQQPGQRHGATPRRPGATARGAMPRLRLRLLLGRVPRVRRLAVQRRLPGGARRQQLHHRRDDHHGAAQFRGRSGWQPDLDQQRVRRQPQHAKHLRRRHAGASSGGFPWRLGVPNHRAGADHFGLGRSDL